MLGSSGAERCLLAPHNINDSNGDDELAWRSWGSRKQGTAHRAATPSDRSFCFCVID
jgi:hypothetical protein